MTGGAIRRATPATFAVALGVGTAAGLRGGWSEATGGFPMLLLHSVRVELDWALIGALVFVVVYGLVRGLVGSRLRQPLAVPLAAAIGLAPAVAAGGYRLNRTAGIRPSELLAAYPLRLNLLFLAAAAVVLCVLTFWLLRSERRSGDAPSPAAPWWRSAWAVAAGLAVAAVLLVHGACAVAFSGPPRTAGTHRDAPDVLVILVDALRADHVGAYGSGRATTPAIDSLAADGVLFRQAISQSTFTKSSIASLFTGRYPYQHGVYWGSRTADPELPGALTSDLLPEKEHTLAELLRGRGLFTAAWVHNSHLRSFMGFGQGFDLYRDQAGDAERITRLATDWFEGPGRRYRTFSYLHYIDVHDPYRPEPPYDTMFGAYDDPYAGVDLSEWGEHLEAIREGRETVGAERLDAMKTAYDGTIRSVDDQIGRLVDALRRSGRYDDSVIVVTADHGDGFLEHGFIAHSTTPYDELVRVPLIVKLPGGRHAGAVVPEQVRLIDVLPTLLDLVDARAPESVTGCSLVPLIGAADLPGTGDPRPGECRDAITEIAEEGGEPTVAVRTERWKLILRGDGTTAVYDLESDPGEQHDLAAEGALDGGEPARLLALARQAVAARTEAVDRIELDREAVRQLKALGYVN